MHIESGSTPKVGWTEEAEKEGSRLLAALGQLIDGGLVADLQHVGATSVPGLPARPCIDLAVAIFPFPLNAELLIPLGYRLIEPQATPYEQRALHQSGHFQLFISEIGSQEWTNHLLLRDFLRQDGDAQRRYATANAAGDAQQESSQWATTKDALFAELLAQANRWWPTYFGFQPVEFVVQELNGFAHPWYISSGWAIDLFLGRVTRVHEDVDVVVNRADQLLLREQLSERGWRFLTPLQGKLEA